LLQILRILQERLGSPRKTSERTRLLSNLGFHHRRELIIDFAPSAASTDIIDGIGVRIFAVDLIPGGLMNSQARAVPPKREQLLGDHARSREKRRRFSLSSPS
jgi:hypothetical protein